MGSLSLLQGNLPNSGIEPRSPALQADSLPAEPQRKLKNTGVGSLSLLQWIFWTQESNWGLLHCRWIPDQLTYQGIPKKILSSVKWPFLPFIRNQWIQLYETSCGRVKEVSREGFAASLDWWIALYWKLSVSWWSLFCTEFSIQKVDSEGRAVDHNTFFLKKKKKKGLGKLMGKKKAKEKTVNQKDHMFLIPFYIFLLSWN